MRRATIATVLLTAFVATSQAQQRVTLEPGFYTVGDLAKRLGTPEHPVRVASGVSHRAAFVSFHERPVDRALAAVCLGLGLQAEADNSGKTITLAESVRLSSRYRTWRNEVMMVLRKRVADRIQLANSFHGLSGAQLRNALKERIADLDRRISGTEAPSQDPAETASLEALFQLAIESPLTASTRGVQLQALADCDVSAVMRGAQLQFMPVDAIGPDFMKVLDEQYGHGLSWSNKPIVTCQIGWTTSISNGVLHLEPVLTLVGDRFVQLTNTSKIGVFLPTEDAARRGLTLSQQLFAGIDGKPLLDGSARDWYRPIDDETAKFLEGDGETLAKSSKTYLSQSLYEWSKETGKDVVMEISPATEVASRGGTFQQRFPNWRFHTVDGVVIAEDVLAFLHRNRPLPVSTLISCFGMKPSEADIKSPTEAELRAYYRTAPFVPIDWIEVSMPRTAYYGLDLSRLDGGRPLLRAWDEIRAKFLPGIRDGSSFDVFVPVASLPERTFTDMVALIRTNHPLEPDFFTDDFPQQFRKMSIRAVCNGGRSNERVVTLFFAPPPEGIGDTLLGMYLREYIEFVPNE